MNGKNSTSRILSKFREYDGFLGLFGEKGGRQPGISRCKSTGISR
jgi:hypothetical protein